MPWANRWRVESRVSERHYSEFFPKHPPSVEDHHRVLYKQGRVVESHTNQFIAVDQRLTELEQASPLNEIRKLEKEFARVESDVRVEVARIRTALYIVGLLLGGGYAGGKAVETLKPPQPIVVQTAPQQAP